MNICAHCKKELPPELQIVKSSSCPFCRADLKTCTNCVFYKPGSHWDCAETISEPVREKDKSNFCDFFRYNKNRKPETSADAHTTVDARDNFSKLFGNEE
ncbi:MAG: hypothetical protein JW904_09720 [Spirochaetales bacterium]|nr:hypothetical protein [Spirochaetales bacterium]